jgi:hypothetical protein
MGFKISSTGADAINSSNELAKGSWISKMYQDDLMKYYFAGFDNDTSILKLIWIDLPDLY